MSESQMILLVGDTFRCERALAERDAALRETDPAIERRVLFGDELDPPSFEIELRSSSLFGLGRHFIVRQSERIKAAKRFVRAIEGEIPEGTFTTLVAREMKATNLILKACKARAAVVSLPPPRGRSVATSAREVLSAIGIEASPDAVRRLVFRNGGDLLGIAQEAQKLRSFGVEGTLTGDTVDRMVYPSAERTVYPFFDHLGERDLAGALGALNELRDDPGRMLGGAIRHLARLAMVRVVLDGEGPRRRLSDALGLPDWMCKRLTDQAKHHTLGSLSNALQAGISLDVQIKSGELSAGDGLLRLILVATRSS